MTTYTVGAQPAGRYRLKHVVKSELLKIATLRSTAIICAVTVIASLLITFFTTRHDLHHDAAYYVGFDAPNEALGGVLAAVLSGGVFGALLMTGEYASGTIRTTLTATPRRSLLLAGKLFVTATCMTVFCELLSFACFFLGEAVLSHGGAPSATLASHGALRAVLMTGFSMALMALMSFSFGLVFRSTAGAISAFVGVIFVLQIVMHGISQRGMRFLPLNIVTTSVISTVPSGDRSNPPVSPGAGLLLMALYAAIPLLIGAGLFVKRDV